MAHDLADLILGAVAAHVVLLQRLLKGRTDLVHALDYVLEDPLLPLEEGAPLAAEEALPEGLSLAPPGRRLLRPRSSPVDPTLTRGYPRGAKSRTRPRA